MRSQVNPSLNLYRTREIVEGYQKRNVLLLSSPPSWSLVESIPSAPTVCQAQYPEPGGREMQRQKGAAVRKGSQEEAARQWVLKHKQEFSKWMKWGKIASSGNKGKDMATTSVPDGGC